MKVLLLVLLVCLNIVSSLHVEMEKTAETRRFFGIEEFGVLEGGYLSISVKNFQFLRDITSSRAGFIVLRAETENKILDSLHEEIKEEYSQKNRTCPFDDGSLPVLFQLVFDNSKLVSDQEKKVAITKETEGLYEISFVHCGIDTGVAFHFSSEMYNKGPNYLSAGETKTPLVLMIFGFFFVGQLLLWISILKKHKDKTHKVHHMMTVFMVLKVLAVWSRSMDLHYIKLNGSAIALDFLAHMFVALRGLSFFLVVIMIGTGWSLLKPALNDKERKFLLFVLPLQVFANIALAVSDEMIKGSSSFMRWRDIFQLVDLLCCIAVAVPIFNHIQFLEKQQGQERDGKAQVNLAKLKQFRRFYLAVILYVYFTRIIIFLLNNSLSFKKTYLSTVFRETAAFLFYLFVGYSFRPTNQNPYLQIPVGDGDYEPSHAYHNDDDDDEDPFHEDYFFNQDEHKSEFGLGDEGVEMKPI